MYLYTNIIGIFHCYNTYTLDTINLKYNLKLLKLLEKTTRSEYK